MTINNGGAHSVHIFVEHFNRGHDRKERRSSFKQDNGMCGYLMRRNRQLGKLNNKISRIVHKKPKPTFYSCKERLICDCFEFVKVGFLFMEKVNNFNAQIFVRVQLHQVLARMKKRTCGH